MLTVFERVPEVIVRTYDAAFQRWGRDYRRLGSRVTLEFRTPVEPSALSLDRRRIVGAVLEAEVDGERVVVRPLDEAAEDALRRHARDLEAGAVH